MNPPEKNGMEYPAKQGHTCKIGGVNVQFPTTPYPSQIGCMNMLIKGLKRSQNCLLESPTGSGKTLAMLSAALAWQLQEAAIAREHNEKVDEFQRRLSMRRESWDDTFDSSLENTQPQDPDEDAIAVGEVSENNPPENISAINPPAIPVLDLCDTDDDSDDDFKETPLIHKTRKVQPPRTSLAKPPASKNSVPVPVKASAKSPTADVSEPNDGKNKEKVPQKKKVPKIFFATRTHQQISQVTQELRKTAYKSVRTVILSSRENTCINPIVSTQPNKNEACKDLLDSVKGAGCGWHSNAKKFANFENLHQYGVAPGYDLEDFVKAGVFAKACPYFASRYLMETADVIFCPYNYLIDPHIRSSMNINLAGEVVIFDEGHNMEDASRESVSYSVDQKDIQDAMQNCEKMVKCNAEAQAHEQLAQFLSEVSLWIDNNQDWKEIDFSTMGVVYFGTEAMASLDVHGISIERIKSTTEEFKAIMMAKEAEYEASKQKGKRDAPKPTLLSKSVQTIEAILRIFDHLTRDNFRYASDFRLALMKSSKTFRNKSGAVTLNLWCLDPSIAFSDIHSVARCVIITSGTLSPFDSFQSELGCPFPIKLECQHIIRQDQIFAKVIHTGRQGMKLVGTFANTSSFRYQDEIGNIILEVCNTVPYGVLVFCPSYRMLEVLKARWELTGILTEFCNNKVVYFEPRSGQAAFLETIDSYYNTIKHCTANPSGTRGALLFAVCRGKVSEGLNFSDNNARAVLCIGIPFPNAKDLQVNHKKQYNDSNTGKGLLRGGKWYEIQAFRALNQAMGRCIRHKNDFGAVFLIDARLGDQEYLKQLPKWFRTRVSISGWNDNTVAELEEYVSSMAPLLAKLQSECSQPSFTIPSTDDSFDSQTQDVEREDSHYFSGMRADENTWKSPGAMSVPTSRFGGRGQEESRTPSMKRQREEDSESTKEGTPLSSWAIFKNMKNPKAADSDRVKKMML